MKLHNKIITSVISFTLEFNSFTILRINFDCLSQSAVKSTFAEQPPFAISPSIFGLLPGQATVMEVRFYWLKSTDCDADSQSTHLEAKTKKNLYMIFSFTHYLNIV